MAQKALLAVLGLLTGAIAEFDGTPNGIRIVGGSVASASAYPYAASLSTGDSHFCGGSLIAPTFVLTAAHCMSGSTNFNVRLGKHDLTTLAGETHRVKRVYMHPGYNSQTMENDIAVIELQTTSSIAPVALDRTSTSVTHTGTDATVVGWGARSEGDGALPAKLHQVSVPVVSKAECNKGYGGSIVNSMLCAGFKQGGKDSCQGDSGGPLFVGEGGDRSQVGVVSWGEGCARRDRYGVYTRVNHYLAYIDDIIVKDGNSPVPSPPAPSPPAPTSPSAGPAGGATCTCVGGPGFGETCGTHGVDSRAWCYVPSTECKGAVMGERGLAWSYAPCAAGSTPSPVSNPSPPSDDGGEDPKCVCDNDGSWGSTCANPDNDPKGKWCFVSQPGCGWILYGCDDGASSSSSPTPPPSFSTRPPTGGGGSDDDDDEEEEDDYAVDDSSTSGATLLAEDFNAKDKTLEELGWLVVDAGTVQSPSAWAANHQEQSCKQTQNIRSREPHRRHTKLGTRLVFMPDGRAPTNWGNDYSFGAQLSSEDNDMLGLFVRYEDEKNFVRLSVDNQARPSGRGGPPTRLVQFVDGVPTLLASAQWRYEKERWHEVEVIVAGALARVLIDGDVVLESGALRAPASGTRTSVGLYSFANRGSAFSALRVVRRDAPAAAAGNGDATAPTPLEMLTPLYAPKERYGKSTSRLVLAQAAQINDGEDEEEAALDGVETDDNNDGDDDGGFFTMTNIAIVAACGSAAVAAAIVAVVAVQRSSKRNAKTKASKPKFKHEIGYPAGVLVNGSPAYSMPSPPIIKEPHHHPLNGQEQYV